MRTAASEVHGALAGAGAAAALALLDGSWGTFAGAFSPAGIAVSVGLAMALGAPCGALAMALVKRVEGLESSRRATAWRVLAAAQVAPFGAAFVWSRWASLTSSRRAIVLALLLVAVAGLALMAPRVRVWWRRDVRAPLVAAALAVACLAVDRLVLVGLYQTLHALLAWGSFVCATAALARGLPATMWRVPTVVVFAVWLVASIGGVWGVERLGEGTRFAMRRDAPLAYKVLALARLPFDRDGDGYASVLAGGDCDDHAVAVHPGALDLPGNGIDEDCSGSDAALSATPAVKRKLAVAPSASNVLLITVDTLRADHMGLYGYARPTTPRLRTWARDAVVYERAYAQSNDTASSVPSLVTGRYPSTSPWTYSSICARGWEANQAIWPRLRDESNVTLAEVLRGHGYATGQLSMIPRLRSNDYAQGIDARHPDFYPKGRPVRSRFYPMARAFLEKHRDERFFLWIHEDYPHASYEKHPGHNFGDKPVDRYDSEIAKTDASIGALLDHLAKLGLDGKTIVALTADHGEEFQEHGGFGHTTTLHEELTHVPLIVKIPAVGGARVAEPVELVDLMPTLLAALGHEAPPGVDGAPLPPVVAGKPDGLAYSERVHCGELQLQALVSGNWKLIRDLPGRSQALYDLHADPGEQRNLADAQPERLRAMNDQIGTYVARKQLHLLAQARKKEPGACVQLARNLLLQRPSPAFSEGLRTAAGCLDSAVVPLVEKLLLRGDVASAAAAPMLEALTKLPRRDGVRVLVALERSDSALGGDAKGYLDRHSRADDVKAVREAATLFGDALAKARRNERRALIESALERDDHPRFTRELAKLKVLTEAKVRFETDEKRLKAGARGLLQFKMNVINEGEFAVAGWWQREFPAKTRVTLEWQGKALTTWSITRLNTLKPGAKQSVTVRGVLPSDGAGTLRVGLAYGDAPVERRGPHNGLDLRVDRAAP